MLNFYLKVTQKLTADVQMQHERNHFCKIAKTVVNENTELPLTVLFGSNKLFIPEQLFQSVAELVQV